VPAGGPLDAAGPVAEPLPPVAPADADPARVPPWEVPPVAFVDPPPAFVDPPVAPWVPVATPPVVAAALAPAVTFCSGAMVGTKIAIRRKPTPRTTAGP